MHNHKKITGIVLNTVPYKDKKTMVNVITSEGVVSFMGTGLNKLTSKNYSATQPLTYASFEIKEFANNKYVLVGSKALISPIARETLEDYAFLSFLNELNRSFIFTNYEIKTLYPYLYKILIEFNNKKISPTTLCLVYLGTVLKLIGFGLNVDECVICGSKQNIVAVSYKEGGYLCAKENLINSAHYDVKTLKILRYIFNCYAEDIGKIDIDKDIALTLLIDLSKYLDYCLGFTLTSLSLFKVL